MPRTTRLTTVTSLSLASAALVTMSLAASPRPWCKGETGANPAAAGLASLTSNEPASLIELAICLDTSGSMQGLLDAARARIWDIVNDLATAQPTPKLRVALLTFGNNGNAEEDGWVKVEAEFTEDLDLVSDRLFALSTNGGEEYVGRVLDTATRRLAWTPGDAAMKLVVVAGNESADQDQTISFRDASRRLIGAGVMVNSIYCGPPEDGLAPAWREVATLADGHFAAIDQSHGAFAIETPYDDELVNLSSAINATYLPFGQSGAWSAENQVRQDQNAQGLNTATAAQRCVTKGGGLYCNSSWDLVDASGAESFKLEEVAEEDLPEVMRPMTMEERKAHVEAMRTRRAEIQEQIAALGLKRQAYVEAEQERLARESGTETFGMAMRKAIRAQAAAHGLTFNTPVADAGADPANAGS